MMARRHRAETTWQPARQVAESPQNGEYNMRYKDIDQKYTELVNKYLTAGYIINSATMAGNEGERASIDLTKDGEIVRVLVVEFRESEKNFLKGTEIIEGRVVEDIEPHHEGGWQNIWNNRLQVISRQRYYEIGENRKTCRKFYGTQEEANRAVELRRHRRYIKKMSDTQDLTQIGLKVAERIIREKFKARRIAYKDIRITKTGKDYVVVYKNNTYRLH